MLKSSICKREGKTNIYTHSALNVQPVAVSL